MAVHFPNVKSDLLRAAMDHFFVLRDTPGIKKKPSTSEFLDWLALLLSEDIDPARVQAHADTGIPIMAGALLKNEQDISLLERLSAMAKNFKR